MTDLTEIWLASQQFEQLENYLKRGRPFVSTTLEELSQRWVELMRAWTENFGGFDHREREDIQAEMTLRDVEPPTELIKDVMETLRCKSKETIAELAELKRDPARYAHVEKKLVKELHRYVRTHGQTSKSRKAH